MPLPFPFTSQTEMEDLFSVHGIEAFSDHQGEPTVATNRVLQQCMDYSTGLVLGKLARKYVDSQLAICPVVREYATVIACRQLTIRRGNPIPESLAAEYLNIIEKDGLLDQLAAGLTQLVDQNGNILLGRSFAPTYSNLQVDRRHPFEKVRVVQQTSSQVTTGLERDVLGGLVEGYPNGN
jgi:hypothetical protein